MTLERLEIVFGRSSNRLDRDLSKLTKKILEERGEDVPLPQMEIAAMRYLINYFKGTKTELDERLAQIVMGMLLERGGRDVRLGQTHVRTETSHSERNDLIRRTRLAVSNLPDEEPIYRLITPSWDMDNPNLWMEFYWSLPKKDKQMVTRSFNASVRELRERTQREVILVSDFRGLRGLIQIGEIPNTIYTSFTADAFAPEPPTEIAKK